MMSPMLIIGLQHTITFTGIIAFVVAIRSCIFAMNERHALRVTGQNGALAAAAMNHLIVGLSRTVAATVSMFGGVGMMVMEPFARPAGVLAAVCWLTYNVLMISNMSFEHWARKRMSQCAKRFSKP